MAAPQPPISVLWGEGRGTGVPRFWLGQSIASDDGTPWTVVVETNDVAPAGLGGECAFCMAFVTVRSAASAVLRLTPILNDVDAQVQSHPDGLVTILQPTITVPQHLAGTPLRARTYEVPLLARTETADGQAWTSYVRGERCRLRVESTEPFGVGAFRLEQIELEYQMMRRSTFAAVTP